MEATAATQSVEPRERQITVAGLRTPVTEAGPAEATEAVVFVHGNPGSSLDWKDLVGRVGTFARALAFDMPGFGRADKPRDFDHTVKGYGDFLEAGLTTLGVERAHLVLHDLGGTWGLDWAARRPDRPASLVLMNTGIFIDYKWHVLARLWQTPVIGEVFMATATRPAFRTLTNRGQKRKLPRSFLDEMYDNFDRDTRYAVLRYYRAEAKPEGTANRLSEALRGRDVPTLIVWGGRDPYLGIDLAHAQKRVFTQARVVELPDSGHWPFIDNPEETAAHVIPFLRETTGASKEA